MHLRKRLALGMDDSPRSFLLARSEASRTRDSYFLSMAVLFVEACVLSSVAVTASAT